MVISPRPRRATSRARRARGRRGTSRGGGRAARAWAHFVAGIAVAGVCALVAGCASSAAGSTASFWAFAGIDQRQQVERYLAENPASRIDLSEIGTSAETADALTAALAADAPPDLVLIQGEELPRFVHVDEHFRDLREFDDALAGRYLPWAADAAITQSGKVIGIPTDVGGMALAYRVDLFAAAGLPTDPADVAALWPTWSDFVEVGADYVARSDAAFVDNIGTTIFFNAVNQLPERYYDESGALIHAENDALRAAFDVAVGAHRAGISAGTEAFTTGWSAGLAAGDFAVVPAPSWMLRIIKRTAPETDGLWRVTSVPGGSGNWGGSYLAIPAGAKNPDAAWAYIAATQSAAGQREHFASGGPLPAAAAPYDEGTVSSFRDPFFGTSAIGEVWTQSLVGRPSVPQGPGTATVSSAYLRALSAVEQGSVSATDAWRSALDAIVVALPTAERRR